MNKKIVYSYNHKTFIFEGERIAHESPLEPGIFLIPANSTEIKPPEIKDKGFIAVFDSTINSWKINKDYRGIYFHKETGKPIKWVDVNINPKEYVLDPPNKNLFQPKWNDQEQKWEETAKIFRGVVVKTKEDVDLVTRKHISDLNEEKIKTLKIISMDEKTQCPEWDDFLQERQKIIKEKNNFLDQYKNEIK